MDSARPGAGSAADPALRRARRAKPAAPAPLAEQRFPLHLEPAMPGIRDLYHQAKKSKWDPEKHIPWNRFAAGHYSAEQLDAARLSWSRRAWSEYGGLAATPALLIRFCLDAGGESDPKMFLTVRGTEESWHVECCWRFAELLGGYRDRPADPAYERVFNQDLHREAFDPALSRDAYVAAHVAVLGAVDLELHRAALAHASDLVACEILRRLTRDKERHVAFGWAFLEARSPRWSAAERAGITAEIDLIINGLELQGYHCAWLAGAAAADIVAADRITHAAGLGALAPAEERSVLLDCHRGGRARLARLGLAVADLGERLPAAA